MAFKMQDVSTLTASSHYDDKLKVKYYRTGIREHPAGYKKPSELFLLLRVIPLYVVNVQLCESVLVPGCKYSSWRTPC